MNYSNLRAFNRTISCNMLKSAQYLLKLSVSDKVAPGRRDGVKQVSHRGLTCTGSLRAYQLRNSILAVCVCYHKCVRASACSVKSCLLSLLRFGSSGYCFSLFRTRLIIGSKLQSDCGSLIRERGTDWSDTLDPLQLLFITAVYEKTMQKNKWSLVHHSYYHKKYVGNRWSKT